jgi:hypothetical protein
MLRVAPIAAAFLVAADSPSGHETKLIEYGIIGALLLAYIVWSRKDKEKSDAQWTATNAQVFGIVERQTVALTESTDAIRDQTRAIENLSTSLRERPCIANPEKRRQ